MLSTARRKLLQADATVALDPANDGELVHMFVPELESNGVRDPLFRDMHRAGAARLRRLTEAFQWEETAHTEETRVSHDTVKRKTTYSYSKHWRSHLISKAFHDGGTHRNPTPRVAPGVAISNANDAQAPNGVHIDADLLAQLDSWRAVPLQADAGAGDEGQEEADEAVGAASAAVVLGAVEGAAIAPLPDGTDCLYLPTSGGAPSAFGTGRRGGAPKPSLPLPASVESYMEGERRVGAPSMPVLELPPLPAVGDARVRFSEVPFPTDGVSVLAQQAGTRRLRRWHDAAQRGRTSGLYMLLAGRVSAQEMLRQARAASDRLKWGLRAGGALLMWLGLGLSLSWVPALVSKLPLLGGIVGSLAGASVGLISLAGAAAVSSVIVAAAWARFRPLHSATLLAAAASVYYGLCQIAVRRQAGRGLGPPQPARRPVA